MLTVRLAASVADVEKGLCATKLAIFSKYLSCLETSFPSVPCLGLVTEVAFGQNTAVAECINTLLFVFHFHLRAWFEMLLSWPLYHHLSPCYVARCHAEVHWCVWLWKAALPCWFFLLFLLLFNHRSIHLWFVFHLPLIWEYSWVCVHL